MAATLTAVQLAIKNGLIAEPTQSVIDAITGRNDSFLASWCNELHPSVKAWRATAPWLEVANVIDFAKYTPSAANLPVDITGLNKLMAILIKLTVQQNMALMMTAGVNAKDAGTMDALLDSVTAIPSGALGANTSPGGASGVNVATVLIRTATRGQVYAGGVDVTKGTVTAKVLVFEGRIETSDIGLMFNP